MEEGGRGGGEGVEPFGGGGDLWRGEGQCWSEGFDSQKTNCMASHCTAVICGCVAVAFPPCGVMCVSFIKMTLMSLDGCDVMLCLPIGSSVTKGVI